MTDKPPLSQQDLAGMIANLVGMSTDLRASGNSNERIIRGTKALVVCNPEGLQKHASTLENYAERLRSLISTEPVGLETPAKSMLVPFPNGPAGEG